MLEYNLVKEGEGSKYVENPAVPDFRRLDMEQRKAINKFKDALVSFIIRETSGIADAENVSMY